MNCPRHIFDLLVVGFVEALFDFAENDSDDLDNRNDHGSECQRAKMISDHSPGCFWNGIFGRCLLVAWLAKVPTRDGTGD